MGNTRFSSIIKLVISIVVCEGAGIIGSVFSTPAIPSWYAALQKPAFTPPNWLFAPAWGTLYLLMGIAAFLVWRVGLGNQPVKTALYFFLIQLVFNTMWSAVFFGMQSPLYGVIVIIILWMAILLTIIKFARISAVAAWLLVPYILWVSFASALNISVWLLNP